ncbi:protein FAR1-RELATED SEQUENCE 5-like [Hordeum vulgare]|nr:protein FAR1-RELATED SEQUENCE 5-like [Hordeum vulgare]
MIRNLRKQKLKDFRKFVYHIWDGDEFERRWVEFMVDYDISEKDAWIMRMYELRKKWSRAYTKGRYFLGMQSNQRSESLNSRLHKNLDRRMSLVDLLEHSDHCLSRIRKNEAELDATASDIVPFTKLAAEPLERSAALIYTQVMFKKVKQQIEQLLKWEVAEVTKNDDVVLYTVARKESRHVTYDVSSLAHGPWCGDCLTCDPVLAAAGSAFRAVDGVSVFPATLAGLDLEVLGPCSASASTRRAPSPGGFPPPLSSSPLRPHAKPGRVNPRRPKPKPTTNSRATGQGGQPGQGHLGALVGRGGGRGRGGDDGARFPPPFPCPLPSAELR